jgi:hypothetical protein
MSGQVYYSTNNSLLVVNQHGNLRRLYVPIAVKTLVDVGALKMGAHVYVEEVAAHNKHKIVYRVFNVWYPYNYFSL